MSQFLTPHASISDSTTQSIAIINTIQPVVFDTNLIIRKVAHSTTVNPSEVTVAQAGDYIVFVAAQVDLTAGSNQTLDMWLQVNGADVPNSNVKIKLVNANDEKLQTLTMSVTLAAGSVVRCVMSGTSTNLRLRSSPADVAPIRPATPSVILTLDKMP